MTDHQEIIELLEKVHRQISIESVEKMIRNGEIKGGAQDSVIFARQRLDQALTLLRTAQEPVSNETEVRHPIDSNGKVNYKISYCYYCGQHVKNQLYCQRCGSKLRWPARPDCTAPEQPNCEGCEFFKHNNKYEHCWRYTQLTSVCKLHHKEQPPASELTDWLRKTISGARYEKGDKELQAKVREACDVIDQRQERPPAGELTKRIRLNFKDSSLFRTKWPQVHFKEMIKADVLTLCDRLDKAEAENKALRRPMEVANFKVDGMLAVGNELTRRDLQIKQLEAKLKAKDELLFAYESVNAPVNPLLAINKDLRDACKMVSGSIFQDRDGEWQLSRPIELLKVITDEAIAKQ